MDIIIYSELLSSKCCLLAFSREMLAHIKIPWYQISYKINQTFLTMAVITSTPLVHILLQWVTQFTIHWPSILAASRKQKVPKSRVVVIPKDEWAMTPTFRFFLLWGKKGIFFHLKMGVGSPTLLFVWQRLRLLGTFVRRHPNCSPCSCKCATSLRVSSSIGVD